jgi:hypothetical protein
MRLWSRSVSSSWRANLECGVLLRRLSGRWSADREVAKCSACPRRRRRHTSSDMSYRDDRFSCVSGADLLVGYKIKDSAPTQRLVASCCNSGMFLKFGRGHWVSMYRARFEGEPPPIEMRTQTKYRLVDTEIPHDAPSYRTYPMKLVVKLLASRLSMLFGR